MQDDGYQIARITFTGWKAVVAGIIAVLLIIACVINVWGMPADDEKMIAAIVLDIKTGYIRDFTAEVRKHLDAGDAKKAAKAGAQIVGIKVNIEFVELAYSVLSHFSDKKDVVAKVTYSVAVKEAVVDARTAYFEMHNSFLDNSWRCEGEVSKIFYYIRMSDDD